MKMIKKSISMIVFAFALFFVIPNADAQESSPHYQFENDILINDIVCLEDRILVLKSSNDMPACVFSESIQKLTERGWIGNIIKIDPKILDEIESASIKKYALEPEFEAQRDIAKQIYKSLTSGQDTPFLAMGLGDDRKSIQFAIDITKLTPEKDKAYYEKLFEENFSGIIPYTVVFQENMGGDE